MRMLYGSSPRMWGTQALESGRQQLKRFIPTHVGNSAQGQHERPNRTVHPHACGELGSGYYGMREFGGSSPRMWGTLTHHAPPFGRGRFIPTHVGNSFSQSRRRQYGPVHPHACGELMPMPISGSSLSGSSPRMWGTPIS